MNDYSLPDHMTEPYNKGYSHGFNSALEHLLKRLNLYDPNEHKKEKPSENLEMAIDYIKTEINHYKDRTNY